MKILLIEFNPFQPSHTPISLGHLAAYSKKQGYQVRILNLGSDSALSVQGLARYLETFRPALVGFSAYQRNIFLINGWAGLFKRLDPSCRIMIGGPQATFLPTTALEDLPFIDYVCRAEGEVALAALARQVQENDPSHVLLPGWSGRDRDGKLWDGPPLDPQQDLDEYPSPYMDGTLSLEGLDEAILLASRGCPYRCAFCYTPSAFGKKIRCHSLERVVEEMSWIQRHGVNRFWFADPSFTFHADRIHRLLDTLLHKALNVQIWLETRVDLVEEGILKKMKRAGVHTVAYGLESASEHVLKKIRKPLSLDRVERAVRLSQEAGLDVELFSQYGLPGERFEDALKTLAFVKTNRVQIRGNTNPQQMQVYFGTEIQKEPERFGIHPFAEPFPSYLSIGSRYETEWMDAGNIREIGRRWKESSEDGGKHVVS